MMTEQEKPMDKKNTDEKMYELIISLVKFMDTVDKKIKNDIKQT